MSFIQIIYSIPDVIWSGIIASLLTLGGVLISNRSNTTRLKKQLAHDSEEKVKERTISLRRDVYLKATEELIKLNSFLVSLPQQDMTKGNFGEGFVGFQTASARIQLVAEPHTALLAMRLSASYGELFFDLMQHLIILGKKKSEIQIADDLYTRANTEVQRILTVMTQHRETGASDHQNAEVLQRNLAFNQEQASKYAADRSAAWLAFNQGNIEFMRHLFLRMRDIYPQQMKLMVEIRRDLFIGGDLSKVELEAQKQLDMVTDKLTQFLQSMESRIG